MANAFIYITISLTEAQTLKSQGSNIIPQKLYIVELLKCTSYIIII